MLGFLQGKAMNAVFFIPLIRKCKLDLKNMYFSIHANVFGRSHYLKLVVASLILFHGFISHLNMEEADWLTSYKNSQ